MSNSRIQKDKFKAYSWLSLSAEQGLELSQQILSGLNNELSGEEKNQAKTTIKDIKKQIESYEASSRFQEIKEGIKWFLNYFK